MRISLSVALNVREQVSGVVIDVRPVMPQVLVVLQALVAAVVEAVGQKFAVCVIESIRLTHGKCGVRVV